MLLSLKRPRRIKTTTTLITRSIFGVWQLRITKKTGFHFGRGAQTWAIRRRGTRSASPVGVAKGDLDQTEA